MPAMTLRLDPVLSKKLHALCKKKGFKKTGLLNNLVRDFLMKEEVLSPPTKKTHPPRLDELVGAISLGGDSLQEDESWFT